MWIESSKLVLCFFICSTAAYAYLPKVDYIRRSDTYSEKYGNAVNGPSDSYKVSKSRYPNLQKLNTRIENMNVDGGSSKLEDTHRIRHKGWSIYRPVTTTTTTTTEDSLFETYGELNDDDDYDILEDEDDDLDYEDDTEDSFFDEPVDIQAEEPTERPTVAPKLVSSLTAYKWSHFGTARDVTKTREDYLERNEKQHPEARKVNEVLEHSRRVNQQGRCRNPSPKVITVQREHPDASKTYTPHCTVLHRCGEDTGCCKYDTTCQYKSRVLVELSFYATTLGSMKTKIEKLSFYNHTECECREKSNETSTQTEESTALTFKSADSYNPSVNVEKCKCPKHFTITPSYHDNECKCDCEEENADCIQLKKGNEHFSMSERICISNKECTIPVCEYGIYSRKEGKCPSIAEMRMEYRWSNKQLVGVNY